MRWRSLTVLALVATCFGCKSSRGSEAASHDEPTSNERLHRVVFGQLVVSHGRDLGQGTPSLLFGGDDQDESFVAVRAVSHEVSRDSLTEIRGRHFVLRIDGTTCNAVVENNKVELLYWGWPGYSNSWWTKLEDEDSTLTRDVQAAGRPLLAVRDIGCAGYGWALQGTNTLQYQGGQAIQDVGAEPQIPEVPSWKKEYLDHVRSRDPSLPPDWRSLRGASGAWALTLHGKPVVVSVFTKTAPSDGAPLFSKRLVAVRKEEGKTHLLAPRDGNGTLPDRVGVLVAVELGSLIVIEDRGESLVIESKGDTFVVNERLSFGPGQPR